MKYETVACEHGGRTGSDRNRRVGFVACVTFTRELGVVFLSVSRRLGETFPTVIAWHRFIFTELVFLCMTEPFPQHTTTISRGFKLILRLMSPQPLVWSSSGPAGSLLTSSCELGFVMIRFPLTTKPNGAQTVHMDSRPRRLCALIVQLWSEQSVVGMPVVAQLRTGMHHGIRGGGGERWIVDILCVAAVGVDRRDPRLCSLERLWFTLCGVYLSIYLSIPIVLAD